MYAIVFTSLVLVVLLAAYFRCNDERRPEVIRFIGAFGVLFAAILSSSSTAYVFAILISGLLIASERFMSLLVAVLARSSDFWTSENFRYMIDSLSGRERQSKAEAEVEETKAAEEVTDQGDDEGGTPLHASSSTPAQDSSISKPTDMPPKYDKLTYRTLLPQLETGTLRYIFQFMQGFGKLHEGVRVGYHMFDGFAESKEGRPYFFEVKVFPNIIDSSGHIKVQQVSTRLRLWLPQIISYFDSFAMRTEQSKPVLMVLLTINSFGDLSAVKEEVKRLRLQKLTDKVILKFQYINLPELLAKGVFVDPSLTE